MTLALPFRDLGFVDDNFYSLNSESVIIAVSDAEEFIAELLILF